VARPKKLNDFEVRQAAVLRRQGVPWKELEWRFGCDRKTLWRAIRRLARRVLEQKTSVLEHLAAGQH